MGYMAVQDTIVVFDLKKIKNYVLKGGSSNGEAIAPHSKK
jgi:hypothetical protein